MRALLLTLGSHGDVHPFIALARALQARGHEAAIVTNPHFEKQCAGAGVKLIPIGAAIDLKDLMQTPGAMHPVHGPRVVLRTMLLPEVPRIHQATAAAINAFRPDVLVEHPICLGGAWAAEQAGVPVVTAALAPMWWMNPRDPIVFGAWRGDRPSPLAVRFDLMLGRLAMSVLLDSELNKLRRSMGLRRERHQLINGFVRPGLNLGLWSPTYRPALPGDPEGGVICGFPWFDAHHTHETPSAEIDRFLNAGDPPIIFSLGTAAVHTPGRFFESAIEACRALNRRGVLLVGRSENVPANLPDSIAAFTYAPFTTLLPRAAAFVHHGGIGTTAQGLRAGRPTLVTPVSHDQFDNAARVKRMGISETLPHRRISGDHLVRFLRMILENPQYASRAHVIGTAIACENGADVATSALETWLEGRSSSQTRQAAAYAGGGA